MAATAVDLSAIKTNALAAAPTFLLTVVDSTDDLPHAANGATITVRGDYGGVFAFDSSDLSAEVTADPDQGLYVPSPSDATGASGAWIRQAVDRVYYADWWLKGISTPIQDILNRAINHAIPASVAKPTIELPRREMEVARAAHGSVNGASAGPPFSPNPHNGILNAIYLDRSCVLRGGGYETHLNGQGDPLAIVGVRASHCRVEKLRAGNIAGQLYLYESAGVVMHPSNFAQDSGDGFSIEDLTVDDCDFYDCDTGVSATPEVDLNLRGTLPADETYFKATKLTVSNCRISYRRQGVELFAADDSFVFGCRTFGLDKGAYEVSRFVRNIGAQRVTVANNICRGFTDDSNGYFGIVLETSGYHHYPPHYELAADCLITGNQFTNFNQSISVESSRGALHITNNLFENAYDTNIHYAIKLNANGVVDEYGSSTDWDNKCLVDRIVVENNQCIGASTFFFSNGTILFGRVANNLFIGGGATDTSLVNISNALTHPLENVHHLEIIGNTAYMNPAASDSGSIRIGGLRAGNMIFVDDNKMTPPTSGGTGIVDSDSGSGATISIRDKYSNTLLPNGLWAAYFSPPKEPIFGLYPPPP